MPTPQELATQLLNAANNVAIMEACSDIIQFYAIERNSPTTDTTYSTIGNLPTANSSNEGFVAYVTGAASLFVSTGTDWYDINEVPTEPIPFQGSTSGFATAHTYIQEFSFASDGNATDVGNLSSSRTQGSGQSSADYGYTSGSWTPGNIIDKFPFVSGGTATDVGDLSVSTAYGAGQSSITNGYGYSSGGNLNPGYSSVIDKFPFAADTNAYDSGDLTAARYGGIGQSSTEYGYTSGGFGTPVHNVIDKFPFSADANATDVGDLLEYAYWGAGQSSTEYGYSSGGTPPSYNFYVTNRIQKFPFASDTNAAHVGYLTQSRRLSAGQSSTDYGYTAGGLGYVNYSPVYLNIIDKFPFSSDAWASDVGDLAAVQIGLVGQQY